MRTSTLLSFTPLGPLICIGAKFNTAHNPACTIRS
jgi:hypothetical protein